MNLTFSEKSIWLAYFHGHVTKTLRYKSFLDLGDAFLIPHEHPLRGDLLVLILLWENLIYHSNFNRKLKTHFLPPNWSVSKSLNSRLLHFLHLSSRYPTWPYCWPFLFQAQMAKMAKNGDMAKMATGKMALRLAKCGI